MRWRIQLSYLGTNYCGWQKQPGERSVQQTLEEAMSTVLRQPIDITGCGRTDTRVHARSYTAHTDVRDMAPTDKILYQVNAVLPEDIAIHRMEEAAPDFHARFQATDRLYRYYIHFEKNPFITHQSFYFHQPAALDPSLMHEAASLLLSYQHFQPFCKTGSDAGHFQCRMLESSWRVDTHQAVYSVRANRFLRGMVRLIVGACLNAGLGKITLGEIRKSLDEQSPMPHAWSVPPDGLFLEEVRYLTHPDTA